MRIALILAAFAAGCTGAPTARRTGFLSDYSHLVSEDGHAARYLAPNHGRFHSFILDPIEIRVPTDHLDPQHREEIRKYAEAKVAEVFAAHGRVRTEAPGPGVARLRIAITDVSKTAWWAEIHPVSNVAGAGAGGVAAEAEVLDSVTGEQVYAVVRTFGRSFVVQIPSFDRLSDAKSALDRWAEEAKARFGEFLAKGSKP